MLNRVLDQSDLTLSLLLVMLVSKSGDLLCDAFLHEVLSRPARVTVIKS